MRTAAAQLSHTATAQLRPARRTLHRSTAAGQRGSEAAREAAAALSTTCHGRVRLYHLSDIMAAAAMAAG